MGSDTPTESESNSLGVKCPFGFRFVEVRKDPIKLLKGVWVSNINRYQMKHSKIPNLVPKMLK